ncbi:GNAT family N-acetyltransferase [Bifidobacterium sp. ESL0704]|uniref:GNAT family N-acetyltransferase n=1 Tax=Bifidobacterium sp. ESL0704 TaxID=2983219 RepID=UPI0023F7345F|nr:GNAT family N-acetyltransferase [Bifidobacterium sp. ESL0704]WEV52197.1 GNAT family N-acetyltransferase [Bifidobacterium sp. ESL0704]
MIVDFGELDQQWALRSALGLETELFGAQAWDIQTLRTEITDTSRTYLADIVEGSGAATTPDADGRGTDGGSAFAPPSTTALAMRGYAGIWHADARAEIMTIGVGKRFQRKGVARNLLDALISRARHCDVRRITLEVRVDNEPAKRLYRSRGFEGIGLLRHYYQPENIDAVEMALDLETHIMGFGSVKENMEQKQ